MFFTFSLPWQVCYMVNSLRHLSIVTPVYLSWDLSMRHLGFCLFWGSYVPGSNVHYFVYSVIFTLILYENGIPSILYYLYENLPCHISRNYHRWSVRHLSTWVMSRGSRVPLTFKKLGSKYGQRYYLSRAAKQLPTRLGSPNVNFEKFQQWTCSISDHEE